MHKLKPTAAGVLVVMLIGVGLSIAFALNRPAGAGASASTPLEMNRPASEAAVPTATLQPQTSADRAAPSTIKATGNLVSANQVNLAFQMPGRVKEINVKEGDRVQAGAVLATLDTSLLDLQVAQAQAALDLSNANLTRVKEGPTVDDMAIAKSNVDRAQAALDQAQAAYDRVGGASNSYVGMLPQSLALQQAYSGYQAAVAGYHLAVNRPTTAELKIAQAQATQAQAAIDLAKQNLTNAKLVAPFDGTAVWLGPKIGESAAPSLPAATLADLSRMQAQVNVDENTLAEIRVGQTATITVDAFGGKEIMGRVQKIGWLGTTAAGIVSVPVTIDLDPTDVPIYPGLSANVKFQVDR